MDAGVVLRGWDWDNNSCFLLSLLVPEVFLVGNFVLLGAAWLVARGVLFGKSDSATAYGVGVTPEALRISCTPASNWPSCIMAMICLCCEGHTSATS